MEAAVDVLFMANTSTSKAPISLRKSLAFCQESIFLKNHNRNVQKEILETLAKRNDLLVTQTHPNLYFFSALERS